NYNNSTCSPSLRFVTRRIEFFSQTLSIPYESMVVLRVPKKHNLYTITLNNLRPRGNLACLVAHASVDESVKWHRRMGHVNYKNMNKLAKGNLVRGLPPKLFKNDHACVACCKGKQHKASYKAIDAVSSIFKPLQFLHIDLFGPTSIRSIDHKYYCLMIINDYSRFCWVFFLEHKDETYHILKDFVNLVENQLNKKVKAIRCDNGTEFKNALMIELYGSKWIKREYSNARTPQQNRVAERKNRTLIKATRTMLADSNDHLGKFDGKADEGYIVGYSESNKAYRVYNVPNKRVEETMKELARLKGQAQRATSDAESLGLGFANDAEELQSQASAKIDRKSTTGGCQFLGRRLILWQCKKQTIMATSSTEAEYVAAASSCGQLKTQFFTNELRT
nr:putative ribonuclease H-like domain-containing protein [Tanacetum cinerariifolium]